MRAFFYLYSITPRRKSKYDILTKIRSVALICLCNIYKKSPVFYIGDFDRDDFYIFWILLPWRDEELVTRMRKAEKLTSIFFIL